MNITQLKVEDRNGYELKAGDMQGLGKLVVLAGPNGAEKRARTQ